MLLVLELNIILEQLSIDENGLGWWVESLNVLCNDSFTMIIKLLFQNGVNCRNRTKMTCHETNTLRCEDACNARGFQCICKEGFQGKDCTEGIVHYYSQVGMDLTLQNGNNLKFVIW